MGGARQVLFSGLPPEHRAEPHFDFAGDHKVAQAVANKPKPQTVAKGHIPVWPVSIVSECHSRPPFATSNRRQPAPSTTVGRPAAGSSKRQTDLVTMLRGISKFCFSNPKPFWRGPACFEVQLLGWKLGIGGSRTNTTIFYTGPLVLVIPQPSKRTAKVFEQGDLGTE